MSKDKYKRKRERAQERAKQKSAQSNLMPSEAITIEKKWQASEDANPERYKEQESAMGPSKIRAYLRKVGFWFHQIWRFGPSSFTDWCLAVFTLALTITAIYQFRITNRQLNVMQIDERAWVES